MHVHLKPLKDQTIVITGVTSGIGLATARLAAKRGAKLVLAARTEEALNGLERELVDGAGAEAISVVADVGNEAEVEAIATAAIARFGGFDTWINNAGVGMFGKLETLSLEDQKRLFDTNFWGVVHGSRAAVRHLRQRGGALINLGSAVSDRSIPVQGIYSASKFAVRGFTDALRMELLDEKVPVVVTLIKPAAIDTPFPEHAGNYLEHEPTLPPPIYSADVVAEAILYAAENPCRELSVGGASKTFSLLQKFIPGVTDKLISSRPMMKMHESDEPAQRDRSGALYEPGGRLMQSGGYPGHVMKSSLYTKAAMHPWVATALVAAAGALGVAIATTLLEPEKQTISTKLKKRSADLFTWLS